MRLGGKAKAIIVNSANNPTAPSASRRSCHELVVRCGQAGIWLLSDETYALIWTFAGSHVTSSLRRPGMVAMSSFSRCCPFGSRRVRWRTRAVVAKIALSIPPLFMPARFYL